MEIYCKSNTNSPGMSLTSFPELGPTRKVKKIYFHEEQTKRKGYYVYSHSSLFFHSIGVAKATPTESEGQRGWIVHGADFGLVFAKREIREYKSDLPGRPIVWVAKKDEGDLEFLD